MVHSVQVLLEVVQAWPSLVRTGAVCPEAHIHHLGPAFWFLVMDTLLMASEVIDSSEAFFTWAVWLIAFEELSVTGLVFPAKVSLLQQTQTSKQELTSYPKDIFQPRSRKDDRTGQIHRA
jgi:hypothetical protein